MTPPLSFANALIQLKTLTSQTANFTFTNDELTAALTTAWQDSFVVTTVWDQTLTYVTGTWQYTVPATLTSVKEIYIILPDFTPETTPGTSTQYPGRVDKSLWEVVAGKIQFAQDAQNYIGSNHTLYLKGNYRLTTSDTLPTVNLINYVLWLAANTLMNQLLLKSAFVFLRNDTTIGEIVAAQKITEGQMLQYKQRLAREFESV